MQKISQCQLRLASREIQCLHVDWQFYNLWKFSQNTEVKFQNTNTCTYTTLLKLLWPITTDDSSDKIMVMTATSRCSKAGEREVVVAKLKTINPTSYDIVTIYIQKQRWSPIRLWNKVAQSRLLVSRLQSHLWSFQLEFPKMLMGGSVNTVRPKCHLDFNFSKAGVIDSHGNCKFKYARWG